MPRAVGQLFRDGKAIGVGIRGEDEGGGVCVCGAHGECESAGFFWVGELDCWEIGVGVCLFGDYGAWGYVFRVRWRIMRRRAEDLLQCLQHVM